MPLSVPVFAAVFVSDRVFSKGAFDAHTLDDSGPKHLAIFLFLQVVGARWAKELHLARL